MKTIFLTAILVIGSLLTVLSAQKLESDNFETKSFDLEPFTSITVSEDIDVELHQSFSHRAEASSNFMEYLRLTVDAEGNLLIAFDQPVRAKLKKNETSIKVWAVNVSKFNVQSGAELEVKSKFAADEQWIIADSAGEIIYDAECKKLNIEVNSKGDFEGKIETDELNANATSGGIIELKGNVRKAHLMVSSKGSIEARKLDADNVSVVANSKGTVSVGVNQELKGEVTSKAKINYKANGAIQLDIKQKSGGGVKEIKGIL